MKRRIDGIWALADAIAACGLIAIDRAALCIFAFIALTITTEGFETIFFAALGIFAVGGLTETITARWLVTIDGTALRILAFATYAITTPGLDFFRAVCRTTFEIFSVGSFTKAITA